MTNKRISHAIIGIGVILIIAAVTNTFIMFHLTSHEHLYDSMIYSMLNITAAALGVVIMLVGAFLQNMERRTDQ